MLSFHILFKSTFFKIVVLMFLLIITVNASWKTELIDCDADERLNAVIIHSSGNMIAIGDEMTVVFSEDGGRNWDESEMPNIKGWVNEDDYLLSSIKEIPGGELIMTLVENDVEQAGIGGPDFERRTAIFSSTNGGKSWRILSKISNAALYWIFVFSDGQCILTGSSNYIYEYKGGIVRKIGENPLADEVMITTMHIEYVATIRFESSVNIKQYGDVLLLKNDNGFYVSKDRGKSWDLTKQFHTDKSINAIALLNDNSIIAGCDNGAILLYNNMGNRILSGTISDRDINDICVSSNCNWWASGDDGLLAFSSDQGKSWSLIKNDYEEDLYSIMISPDCKEIWICGDEGGLVHVYDDQSIHSLTEDDEEETTENSLLTPVDQEKDFCLVNELDSLEQGLVLSVGPDTCTIITGTHIYVGSSFKIQLPVGEHTFKITKSGYFPRTENIRIKKREVQEEKITLRKIKGIVAPSGGFSLTLADYGINISLLSGVLGFNKNAVGLECNVDFYIDNSFDLYCFSAFYGREFNLSDKTTLFPSISIGGAIIQETKIIETKLSYSSGTVKHVNKGALFLNTTANFQFKRNNRWGYILRPSMSWIGNWGMQFSLRFGGIVWI